MKKHRYRITVESLADKTGAPVVNPSPLQFEVCNHDDILRIVEQIKSRGDFSAEDAPAFALGLKLFSEILLENRSHPMFKDFLPHFKNFMKQLKQSSHEAQNSK